MRRSGVRFQLLSRHHCHLCDEMKAVVEEVFAAHGETFEVEDVDADPAWRARFGTSVPVLLRNDVPVAKVRTDRAQLERILRRRRS